MKITLLMATTIDGKIANRADQPATWTSPEDKQTFVKLTKQAGVVIMGHNTYKTIGRPLPGRLNIILTSQPEKQSAIANLLEYHPLEPKKLIDNLEKRGFTQAVLGGGAYINKLFWEAYLIDELIVTIEPLIFGHGPSLLTDNFRQAKLTLIKTKRLGQQAIQLHYRVHSQAKTSLVNNLDN